MHAETVYRRHFVGGESLRAIARDMGVQPSTVLRQVRRVEALRDADPVYDSAIEAGDDPGDVAQVLDMLALPDAVLIARPDMPVAVIAQGSNRVGTCTRAEVAALIGTRRIARQRDMGGMQVYRLIPAVRQAVRRQLPVPVRQIMQYETAAADRAALAPFIGRGMSIRAIASELGWTARKVRWVADREGLAVRRTQQRGNLCDT